LLAHTFLRRREFGRATAILVQAEAWGARHANLDLLQGSASEFQAVGDSPQDRTRLECARCCYEACLLADGQIFTEEIMPGATSWMARTRLGTVLLRLGDPAEALVCFENALTRAPDPVEAELGRVEALLALGKSVEALTAVEPLLERSGPDGWVLAARATADVQGDAEVTPMLERAFQLAEDGFIASHRRAQLLELRCRHGLAVGLPVSGPGWSGLLGAIAGRQPALDHPQSGAAPPTTQVTQLVHHWLSTGRSDLLETFLEPRADRLAPGLKALTLQTLAQLGADVSDDGEPEFIFIGGAGRSGTTLLRAMLDAHPRIACGPELKLVPAICALREQWWRAMGTDLLAAGLDEPKLDAAVRAFVKTLLEGMVPDPKAVRIAEKTPHNLLHMAMLGQLFPRARFVHVVRDGRAVAASLVRQAWQDPATGKPVWYCQDLASGARYWSQVVQTIREQALQVPGRYLELRYEDLVQEPRQTMARLLAFLGEPWDERVLRHHDQVRVSSLESSSAAVCLPVKTDAVDRWRQELLPEQLVAISREAGSLLQEWEVHDSS
jgi:tetratricopeptide (TPR) repeat protein